MQVVGNDCALPGHQISPPSNAELGKRRLALAKRFMSSGCEHGWVLDRDGLWGRGGLGSGADDADFCRNACASCGVRKLSDDAFA